MITTTLLITRPIKRGSDDQKKSRPPTAKSTGAINPINMSYNNYDSTKQYGECRASTYRQ